MQNYFCQNFVKFQPTVEIFGTKNVKRSEVHSELKCEVRLFSTSPNLCQRTTVLNGAVQNCYITQL